MLPSRMPANLHSALENEQSDTHLRCSPLVALGGALVWGLHLICYCMPPKKAPTLFEVDGVRCSVKDGLVNVGLNEGWPRELRFPMRVKPTEDVDSVSDKVRSHDKFAALLAHAARAADADQAAPRDRSRSPEPPLPPTAPPSASVASLATTCASWPPKCTKCKQEDSKYHRCAVSSGLGKAVSLCESCFPKDEHGNFLCMKCMGLRCAECEACECHADIVLCGGCKVPFCNVPCDRRGDCHESGNDSHEKHYDRGCFINTGFTGHDCNAPLGLGCQCSCCRRLQPPLCVGCTESGPCQDCLGQWEYLREASASAYSNSKYGKWHEHWCDWWTHAL